MRRLLCWLTIASACCVAQGVARAQANDLIVDGTGVQGPATFTVDAASARHYDNVCVIHGGVIRVIQYVHGSDKHVYGNLELVAGSIFVDATSKVTARAAGYTSELCGDGDGPTSSAGGRGGCSLRDSAGGGAHFGPGGRGTIDRPMSFPADFEDDCMNTFTGTGCSSYAYCAGALGLGPSVAGVSAQHNVYQPEFGAAGGDKGCMDGDGFTSPIVGGAGGGRVALVGLSARGSSASPCGLAPGTVHIDGTVDARGARGCGVDNDSGGGGAGGSVLVVGEKVELGPTALITAAGGLGGDARAAAVGQPDYLDCPAGAQTTVAGCDDCGGGGGGGVISVLSVRASFDPSARFDVSGALGGTCPLCQGEAGGGAGELQLDGAYIGEVCDGFDNDFDGVIDEGFSNSQCGLGVCAQSIPSCSAGEPAACAPTVTSDPSCKAAADGGKPRVMVILDTSASMLLTLTGYPTFGDGSVEHPGIDTDGDGQPNDSRLFLARETLAQVMTAYPELDFGLARYHQDEGPNRSCQAAAWFECQGLVASYDDPRDNSGAHACDVSYGPNPGDTISVLVNPNAGPNPPVRTECINYAGSCGPARRGADILSGFGTPLKAMVKWLDGKETAWNGDTTPGDFCAHRTGGDCEVRGAGPTPLAGSLQAVEDYIRPVRATDPVAGCRDYSVILVTDGAESCAGDPVSQARHLHDVLGIDVNVIAVSVLPSEQQALNGIAMAGSGGTRGAAFVSQPQELMPALTSIVSRSVRFETCNGLDDDCDSKIDEDFTGLGQSCNDGGRGICRGLGALACNTAGDSLQCNISTPPQSPGVEICNNLDDDCDGAIDESLDCTDTSCVQSGEELCNGKDDDCDGKIDEADPSLNRACGSTRGECTPGVLRCVSGSLMCIGGVSKTDELCNGRDDNCNGQVDDDAVCPKGNACVSGACRRGCDPKQEFPCPVGMSCVMKAGFSGGFCLPSACSICKTSERCAVDHCVDACQGVKCDSGSTCVNGQCVDCAVSGCATGQVCYDHACEPDPCARVKCATNDLCWDGKCLSHCDDAKCPSGQSCGSSGGCEVDPCASVTCPAHQGDVCRGGKCVADPCASLSCVTGDVCLPAVGCVADPCAVTHCPVSELCTVGGHGEPVCAPPKNPNEKPHVATYVATSGSGLSSCSVSAPGRPAPRSLAPFGMTLLFARVFVRRSRRRT